MAKSKYRVRDMGGYLVDEHFIGEFSERTNAVIMDNVQDRNKMKTRVKIMRTENINLLAGMSTVAVFHVKHRGSKC